VIVDSSALIGIVLRQDGWEQLVAKLAAEPTAVGAPTLGQRLLFVGTDFSKTDLPVA